MVPADSGLMRLYALLLTLLSAIAGCGPTTEEVLPAASEEVTISAVDPYRINGAPIAAAASTGRLLIARVSTGGQVSARLHSGDWRSWRELGGSISSGLSITERGGEFRIYGRGTDQAMWMISYNAATDRWSEWRSLGGVFSSAPSAVVWPGGLSTVFARGGDTQIWAINEDPAAGGFGAWYSLGGDTSSAPAAALGGGVITLAARNRADGRLLVRNFEGAGWGAWTALGGAITTAPAVARTAERSVVVAAGVDQTLWAATFERSSWTSVSLGGVASSEPSVVTEGATVRVAVRGAGSRPWSIERSGGGAWGFWTPLRSDLAIGTALQAVNDGGYLDLLALSPDGGLFASTRPPAGRFEPWYTLEGGPSSVTPTPTEEPFGNPGMGWILEEWTTKSPNYGPNCRQTNPFTLVDSVEVFDAWSFIERAQGVYDWSRLDESIAFWTRQGKRIILRVSTEDLGCYACGGYAGFRGIPEWLRNQLSASLYSYADISPWEFPDYQNATYQAALLRFLGAYGAKYRDNPFVDAVGLRGYGQWGEWHSGHNFPDEASRISTLRWLIDQWLAPWQGKKTLMVSASYEYRNTVVPASASLATYGEHDYAQFRRVSAFDHAEAKPNLAFRRDGFDAGLANVIKPDLDGRLLNEAFDDGRMLPNFAEFFGDYEWFRTRSASRAGLDHALRYHPNYAVLQGWTCSDPEVPGQDAARFYRDQLETVVKPALMRGGLGYRFEVGASSYTHRLGPGVGQFLVDTSWRNLAVGRATTNFGIRYYLVDASTGREVWAATYRGFDFRTVVGAANPTVRASFPAPALPAGDYLLKLALVDSAETPAVKLAISGRDVLGRYPLGVVRSTATGPSALPSTGNDLLIDFGQPYGLWARRNDREWVGVHSASPVHMIDGDLDGDGLSDPLVDFGPAFGLWIWRSCAVWEQIHSVSARELATRDADGDGRTEYVVDFGPAYGIWEYHGGQEWRAIHGTSARHMLGARLTSDHRGDLVVDFGAAGIWSLSGSGSWTPIHGTTSDELVATDMDGNGVDELIVDFGPTYGLWMRQNGRDWFQLHARSPSHLVAGQFDADRRGDLVADFGPGIGLFRYESSSWRQLHGTPSELVSKVDLDRSGAEDLLVDFGAVYGLWALKNGTSWVQQHSVSPSTLAGIEMDGL